ncbi:MAG: class I SAM-dependent methyltransferase [Gammaproteobacteria bacterium]|nr:class I SAM-dependent methyltransferase [Gammaproteobacteria bacterium]
MLSNSYTDPRLTAVYDPLNPGRQDIDFYLAVAGDQPMVVLDVGCGTGRLACEFAARGHQMTGADPALAMLDVARNRVGGNNVTWVNSSAVDLSLDTRFDLIIMTGHAFQVILEDTEILSALRNLHSHLAPGGRLAFETRNPAVREWDKWTPEQTREVVRVPDIGDVQVHNDISAEQGQLVTYETHFKFADDDIVVTYDTLRFLSASEVAKFLDDAGFRHIEWLGNWDESELAATNPEIIVIAD